jgi:Zn finger protein HypA/HybF involved in hydrogenase expression
LVGVEFVVEDEPARFRCRGCGEDFTAGPPPDDAGEAVHLVPELSHAYLRCPACGSPDFEIVAGRGVTLRTIEGTGGEG